MKILLFIWAFVSQIVFSLILFLLVGLQDRVIATFFVSEKKKKKLFFSFICLNKLIR